MDAFIARQPIFDKAKKIFGYELLFRDSLSNFMPNVDGDMASSKVLATGFLTFGIESLIGSGKAFINFTRNLMIQQIPLIFPKENTVIEILETVDPDAEVLKACKVFAQKGYLIALDDFEYSPRMHPLIAMADIIKFDFRATSIADIHKYLEQLPVRPALLLAEKIETHEEFDIALEMGFDLFQGYFFCKPEVFQHKEIQGSQLILLQIMAEANKPDIVFDHIETQIERDVALSYKLLRYINSAYFAQKRQVSSIRQALVLMGENEIRHFVSLMAMAHLAENKPQELIRASCVRASFCELLGGIAENRFDKAELFTLGLFSLIDAILDQPMDRVMKQLPLSAEIKNALIHQQGLLAIFLNCAICYERGDWQGLSALAGQLGLDEGKIPHAFVCACDSADKMSG